TSRFQMDIDVMILPHVMDNQPSEPIKEILNIPDGVVLADPDFRQPGSIDLILSAEVFTRIVKGGIISLGKEKPRLLETTLGWIVMGPIKQP
ncbi:hypothetical protein KR084_012230, partial [Drosophila pseudotakahashii]